MLFTCIKSWFVGNHLANFHQISHWSFCWNVIDSLFKWSCSIDCQAHIFFFKTKNCSNDDIFISCDDRIGKMLHNICMSAVAMSLRWTNRGPWPLVIIYLSSDRLGLGVRYPGLGSLPPPPGVKIPWPGQLAPPPPAPHPWKLGKLRSDKVLNHLKLKILMHRH